jgi:hypothetical protein
MQYEAPAVAAVTEVSQPLIGFIGSGPNPTWNDEPAQD